jgi:hypothetical protein
MTREELMPTRMRLGRGCDRGEAGRASRDGQRKASQAWLRTSWLTRAGEWLVGTSQSDRVRCSRRVGLGRVGVGTRSGMTEWTVEARAERREADRAATRV